MFTVGLLQNIRPLLERVRSVAMLSLLFARLQTWRRMSFCFVLGLLVTFAFPPYSFVLIVFMVFPVFLWTLDGTKNRRQAFWVGFFFGWGYFIGSVYWVGVAFLVDIERFLWAMPFSIAGLAAYLALYCGLVTWLVSLVPWRGVSRCLGFAVFWVLGEWLRGHLLTGFPWNLIGSVWTSTPVILQSVSVVGVYGLSLLTVTLAALPTIFAHSESRYSESLQRGIGCLLVGIVFVVSLVVWGGMRLENHAQGQSNVPDVTLRLVQSNFAQKAYLTDEERMAIFQQYLRLSSGILPEEGVHLKDEGVSSVPTMVIWPEAAVPFLFEESPGVVDLTAAVTPPDGFTLIGTPRRTMIRPQSYRFYNGVVVINKQGETVASYNKRHLVPFGEYFPYRTWFNRFLPIDTIATGSIDFSAGTGPRTLVLPGLPSVGMLICYEVIFPHAVVDATDRPQWLLNVTNDSWFGHTTGPHQHFSSAIIRAVEEGIPVVRVATTGISGVIDAYGHVRMSLPFGQMGLIDTHLPTAHPQVTLYARLGDTLVCVLGVFFLIVSMILNHNVFLPLQHKK